MAIGFVRTSKNGIGSAGSSISVTMTSPAAGNTLIIGVLLFNFPSTGTYTVTTGGGTGSDTGTQIYSNSTTLLGSPQQWTIWAIAPVGASRTSVVVTLSGNCNSGSVFVWEVSGLSLPTVDQSAIANNQSGSNVNVGPTGTLAASNEFCLYMMGGNLNSGNAPSPWVSDSTVSATGDAGSHQVVTANTAISVSGGSKGTSTSWGAMIASVMIGTAGPPPSSMLPFMGVG